MPTTSVGMNTAQVIPICHLPPPRASRTAAIIAFTFSTGVSRGFISPVQNR